MEEQGRAGESAGAPLASGIDDATARTVTLAPYFEYRDQWHAMVVAFAWLVGREPELSAAASDAIEAFDVLLDGELHRLLPMNDERQRVMRAVAPSARDRVFWWSWGATMGPMRVASKREALAIESVLRNDDGAAATEPIVMERAARRHGARHRWWASPQLAWGVTAVLAVVAGFGGWVMRNKMEESDAIARQAAEAQRAADQATQQLSILQRQLAESEAAIARSQRDALAAKTDLEKAAAQRRLQDAQETASAYRAKLRASGGGGSAKPVGSGKVCNCAPGDPLCSCL